MAPQRLLIGKLLLDVIRIVVRTHFGDHFHYGALVSDLLLCVAVGIGDLEDKPMTSTKVAIVAGLPRPTAIRRLRDLEVDGIIIRQNDGTYKLSRSRMNSRNATNTAKKLVRMFSELSTALSNLDR